MSDWQPIDTARKNGRVILLYVRWAGKRYRVTGRWSKHVGAWLTELTNYTVRPTHWQPLPAPPESET